MNKNNLPAAETISIKDRLVSYTESERIKDAIASKSKTVHVMLTVANQVSPDFYTKVCERLDDFFDYVIDSIPSE